MSFFIIRRIISGFLSYIINLPIIPEALDVKKKARYFYSVYLRHLVLYHKINPRKLINVIEIGPGKVLGCGALSLILGTDKYVGIDIFDNYDRNKTLAVFDELVNLVSKKESIPKDDFPQIKPVLANYEFPSDIFTDSDLEQLLNPYRIEKIKELISDPTRSEPIQYIHIRNIESAIFDNIDFIFSQAGLEYIEDLDSIIKKTYTFLNPLGVVSHQIDLGNHSTAKGWNEHYRYSSFLWWVIKGNYKSFIQRRPYSFYKDVFSKNFYNISNEIIVRKKSTIKISELSKSFKHFNKDDLNISSLFIQATKF